MWLVNDVDGCITLPCCLDLLTYYCFRHRSLKSIQTQWSASHTWRVPVEGCGWRSPRAPPSVSFILKHWSFCRKSTSQLAQRCRTPVHIHHTTLGPHLHIQRSNSIVACSRNTYFVCCCCFLCDNLWFPNCTTKFHFIGTCHTFVFIMEERRERTNLRRSSPRLTCIHVLSKLLLGSCSLGTDLNKYPPQAFAKP